MNWDNAEDRAALIERVGPDEYNRLHEQHRAASAIEVVNGHAIRAVGSRFGRVFMVDGTGRGAATIEGARQIAKESKAG